MLEKCLNAFANQMALPSEREKPWALYGEKFSEVVRSTAGVLNTETYEMLENLNMVLTNIFFLN
uniref:Uncharacterized protein n=1 Tax=Romanomermis culicivorax TaxID=13658 RepID=A0A915HS15_ROMCU